MESEGDYEDLKSISDDLTMNKPFSDEISNFEDESY